MSKLEPRRLTESEGVPVDLRDALQGLARETASPETLAQVRRALWAAPSAGAGAVGAGGVLATKAATSTVALGVAAALAAAATVAWLMRPESEPSSRHMPPRERAPAASIAADEPAGLAGDPPEALPVPAAPPPVESEAGTPGARRHGPVHKDEAGDRSSVRRQPAVAPRPARGRPVRAFAPSTDPAQTETAPPPRRTPLEPEGAGEEDRGRTITADPGASVAKPQVAEPQPAEPQDEAAVLYRARRASIRDPQAALRWIALHRRHFPQGALVEEREVLAIELQRKLGNDTEAERLLDRFRTRFPHSVYLRSVSR